MKESDGGCIADSLQVQRVVDELMILMTMGGGGGGGGNGGGGILRSSKERFTRRFLLF